MQVLDNEEKFYKLITLWNCSLSTASKNIFGTDAPHIFMEAGRIALGKLREDGVEFMKETPVDTINAIYSRFAEYGYFKEAGARTIKGEVFEGKYVVLALHEKWKLDLHACCRATKGDESNAHACLFYNLIRYALFSRFSVDLRFLDVKYKKDSGELTLKAALVPASKELVASARVVEELGHRGTALKKVSEDYARAINMSLDAVVSADGDGRIILWNPAAERVFGYSHEEVVGSSVEILIPQEHIERHREGMKRFKDTGEAVLIGKVTEVEALKKDGTKFPAEIGLSADRSGGMWLFTALIRDITGRKRLEHDLMDKLGQMERLNRLMVGRELKMEALRKEVLELRARLNAKGV